LLAVVGTKGADAEVVEVRRIDRRTGQFGSQPMQSEGTQDGLRDDRCGGPDIKVGAEDPFGDAALHDVSNQLM
jgi:hypothetical protein